MERERDFFQNSNTLNSELKIATYWFQFVSIIVIWDLNYEVSLFPQIIFVKRTFRSSIIFKFRFTGYQVNIFAIAACTNKEISWR
jgi:hypothetical protein